MRLNAALEFFRVGGGVGNTEPIEGLRIVSFRLVDAQPIIAQLVPVGGVHGGKQFKRIQRLAAGVDLFEHHADGLVGCVGTKGDDGDLVTGDVREHLVLEVKKLAHTVLTHGLPMLPKPLHPTVVVKNLVQWKHQLRVFQFRR